MTRLIVYAGANGAGKSTLRDGGADLVDLAIDPDRIARLINPAAFRTMDLAAGKEALRLFDVGLQAGQSLSLETTLTGRTVLARMRAAKDVGYDVTLRYVALASVEQNLARVDARARAGGHWIAPEVIARRVGNSLDNLAPAIAIADRSVLFDNSGPSHRRVLEVEQGRISFQSEQMPAWLASRLPQVRAQLEKVSAGDAVRVPGVFDPFGDRASRGYLRNALATDDPALIARIEARAFSVNVQPALQSLETRSRLTHDDVLSTHRQLFQSVYPWAGQDRSVLAPDIAISKGGASDLFAHPRDVRRGIEHGLEMAREPNAMRDRPGTVFGQLAYAHPFLDGNGRVLMVVHADLALRSGLHLDWSAVSKEAFLQALTAELCAPGTAMDALLKPLVRPGPLPSATAAERVLATPGFRSKGPSPGM